MLLAYNESLRITWELINSFLQTLLRSAKPEITVEFSNNLINHLTVTAANFIFLFLTQPFLQL